MPVKPRGSKTRLGACEGLQPKEGRMKWLHFAVAAFILVCCGCGSSHERLIEPNVCWLQLLDLAQASHQPLADLVGRR